MKKVFHALLLLLGFIAFSTQLNAQAKLSIQGILKKVDGSALIDGDYNLKFRIYNVEAGGTALWTETQTIALSGGVYSAILGEVTPLNIPFDQPYWVGVSVGSAIEMQPRIALTSAPYAISIIGQTNLFPSTGTVKSDNEIISGKLAVGQAALPTTQSVQVNGGILAKGGAPGADGANNTGYAFGAPGDNDSGLYSTNDSTVSLYINNVERLQVNGSGAVVTGNATIGGNATINGNVTLNNNGAINYGGVSGWRLVYRDDFENNNSSGWLSYGNLISSLGNPPKVFTYNTSSGVMGDFIGVRASGDNAQVLKKQYDLSAFPHSHVRVTFTYHAIDSWDFDGEVGWGGISDGIITRPSVGWKNVFSKAEEIAGFTLNYAGDSGDPDSAVDGLMTFQFTGNDLVVFFGGLNLEDISNETFAIDNVEVWVR
jgi:hypothetical protein